MTVGGSQIISEETSGAPSLEMSNCSALDSGCAHGPEVEQWQRLVSMIAMALEQRCMHAPLRDTSMSRKASRPLNSLTPEAAVPRKASFAPERESMRLSASCKRNLRRALACCWRRRLAALLRWARKDELRQ